MGKRAKRLLIGFIILWLAGFLVVWGWTFFKKVFIKKSAGPPAIDGIKEPKSKEPEAVSVRCYKAGRTDFKDDLPVMGVVKGTLEIELKFEVNGVIESINFREGDVIYKGDLVAALYKKDAALKMDYARSKLESSKVQLLSAKKKMEIFENLYEIGGIIKAKLEEVELEEQGAELQIATAEVELASAEAEREKTNLYAPRDGVLGSREAEVGEFFTLQNRIGILYDIKEVFIDLGIVEKDIDKIALGQNTAVTVDTYPGEAFTGSIDNVFPIIEGKSRTLTVRVRIQNPNALLLPGMFARALITVAEFKNAIVIPSMSLNKTDQGYNAFIVDEKDTVTSRIVQPAYVTTDWTVIDSGISEGEIVVSDTPQELRDGTLVSIIELQESGDSEM